MAEVLFPNSCHRPPGLRPWSASDPSSFAYESATARWPRILSGIINALCDEIAGDNVDESKAAEAKRIMSLVSELKHQSTRDSALIPLVDDGGSNVALYNAELEKAKAAGQSTWFTASWLFCETYLYRRLRAMFASTRHFASFDPFLAQKTKTLRSSGSGVAKAAASLDDALSGRRAAESDLSNDEVQLATFYEMAQMLRVLLLLKAQASELPQDLSLLTSLSHEDIQRLQRPRENGELQSEYLLINDLPRAWQHIRTLEAARLDIVLDNSAFELVCDLVFCDWLVTCTPHVGQVVFHGKDIPWFVSDVLPADVTDTLAHLLDRSFFPDLSSAQVDLIHGMSTRWRSHFDEGTWRLSVPLDLQIGALFPEKDQFWTNPLPFWDIVDRGPALLEDLAHSGLVIFKGDLNYRKLTGDARWPNETSFATALGPLAGQFPLLALRTLKADVICGLETEKVQHLDRHDPRWRVSGQYAVASLCLAATT